MTSTTSVSPTGQPEIDGIILDFKWAPTTLTYGFPTTAESYNYRFDRDVVAGFAELSAAQVEVVSFALDTDFGPAANDGFAVEGFTNLDLVEDTSGDATLRFANTTASSVATAFAYYPNFGESGGDAWFGPYRGGTYLTPQAGNYAWHTHLHETGHTLGLTHPHEDEAFGTVPLEFDHMEMTVMSYRSYEGSSLTSSSNETWGYAQTFMMLDIAALQHLYGADYVTNSGDTVYVWTPGNGNTLVDGAVAIEPGGNRIFLTIWDGGGSDTYDLSAYETDLQVSLQPGASSLFSDSQAARLGNGYTAHGNVYNALLYAGNTASLIENAIGGAGDDTIEGNSTGNALQGNAGNDWLRGEEGADTLHGGDGGDTIDGGKGSDKLFGQAGNDTLNAGAGNDRVKGDKGRDVVKLGGGDDLYTDHSQNNSDGADHVEGGKGNDTINGLGGHDTVMGNGGRDLIQGGQNGETLKGGKGNDTIFGGAGKDQIWGDEGSDVIEMGDGADLFTDDEQNDANGADLVKGGKGADTLTGGGGNDSLKGNNGDDVLTGGIGDDMLWGGAGADRFEFAHGHGADTIKDFEDDVDTLLLSGFAVADPGAALDLADEVGGDVVFDFGGGDTLTLLDMTKAALADDILIG